MAAKTTKKKDAPTGLPGGQPAPIVIPKKATAKPIDPSPEPTGELPGRPKR